MRKSSEWSTSNWALAFQLATCQLSTNIPKKSNTRRPMHSNDGEVFGKVFLMRMIKYETAFWTCLNKREVRNAHGVDGFVSRSRHRFQVCWSFFFMFRAHLLFQMAKPGLTVPSSFAASHWYTICVHWYPFITYLHSTWHFVAQNHHYYNLQRKLII